MLKRSETASAPCRGHTLGGFEQAAGALGPVTLESTDGAVEPAQHQSGQIPTQLGVATPLGVPFALDTAAIAIDKTTQALAHWQHII